MNTFCRTLVHKTLQNIDGDELRIEDPWGAVNLGRSAGSPILVRIDKRHAYRKFVLNGTLGAAQSFIDGDWDCPDPVAFFRAVIRSGDTFQKLERYRPSVVRWSRLMAHKLRNNSWSGSRRNIKAHYDLGNEFFELFLDPTLCYSCGYFEKKTSTLEEASIAKMERVIRKLELTAADHLLEIGCGWGALSLKAAESSGCRVTAVTISKEQFAKTKARIAEKGLSDRVTVLLQDYRAIEGQFTKIASIEMIEAVGYKYYETFFRKCSSLLTADGMFLIQAITRPDRTLAAAKKDVEFIQAQIFPGSELPTIGELCRTAASSSDLMLTDLEDITAHYGETLKCWRENFVAKLSQVRAQGFSEEFIRQWIYYFACCEASFRERYTGDIQVVFTKPGWRSKISYRESF